MSYRRSRHSLTATGELSRVTGDLDFRAVAMSEKMRYAKKERVILGDHRELKYLLHETSPSV
ncbi:unnamed protein product [Brassica oleracea var. botrytis]